MPRTVFALVVGIDAYRDGVPRLQGCVNDARAAASLLAARTSAAGDPLRLRLLLDDEATRAGVVYAFRDHLGAAGPDDVAVFWYAGHGAQEPTLPEHLHLEPDGLNETLVLVDSRAPGVFDLADKELAQLVAEIAARGTHVLVVLDCCHSGSGVRDVADPADTVRRAPTDDRPRPRESYLDLTYEVLPVEPVERADWLNLPASSRYVLLAACRSDQTAKETRVDGVPRGALSTAVERVLARTAGPVTYRDLHLSVLATVRSLVDDQTPMLEAPETGDITRPFLGGAASPLYPVLTASLRDGRWVLDAGRVHGIADPATAGPTELALTAPTGDGGPVASAVVVATGPSTATLRVTPPDALDPELTYRAMIRSAPVDRIRVGVRGAGADADAVRTALAPSPLLAVVGADRELDPDDLLVTVADGSARTTAGRGGRPLIGDIRIDATVGPGPETVPEIREAAERIARWQAVRDRANPSSRLPAAAADLTALDPVDGSPLPVGAGGIERRYSAGGDQPTIALRVRNGSTQRLYYAVVALSDLFGVTALRLPHEGVWLDAGEEAWVLGDDDEPRLFLELTDGRDRSTDLLKLIVSTQEFDARALDQPELAPPSIGRGASVDVAERGISGRPALPERVDDWITAELPVTTVRGPRPEPIGLGRTAVVGTVVEGRPHPRRAATAWLGPLPEATREAVAPLLPPLLLDVPGLFEPLPIGGGTRDADGDRSVLWLSDVQGADTVTTGEPLRLTIAQPLRADERIVVFGSDGEDVIPLGVGRGSADGERIDVRLNRLPQPSPDGLRGLGGSLKLLFQKLLHPLGVPEPYPLGVVHAGADGEVVSVRERDGVAAAVAGARRVLLLVHGIIGDTRGMSAAAVAGEEPFGAGYDVVVTYDYENLLTSIDEAARTLRDRLTEAGLAADAQVDVVAHSMGGLVGRWWIEREGGADRTRRLVTCGTPHAGSPWPRVEDVAITVLTFVTHRIAEVTGPLGAVATAVGFLVQGIERVDVTLDQMRPGSPFLTELAGSADPAVDYRMIAGDHPFGPASEPGRIARLLQKLRVPDEILDSLFGGPNDIAVSVASATAVADSRAPRPRVLDADCNHLSYFSSAEGTAAIGSALR